MSDDIIANENEDEDVRLYCGDCLGVMAGLAAGSVDLIAADLPYGTTACRWDAVIPFGPMWSAFRRMIKFNGVVLLTASQPFTSALVMSNTSWFKYALVWEKSTGNGFLDVKFRPLKAHEDVAIFSEAGCSNGSNPAMCYRPQMRQGPAYTRTSRGGPNSLSASRSCVPRPLSTNSDGDRYPRSVLYFGSETGLHPTQKPVALFEYLILTYSNPGETVLDCTMGSGTTGLAAVNTGRRFIGIEQDPTYFQIATQRIDEARRPLVVGSPLMSRRPRASRPESNEPSLFDVFG